MPEASSNRQKFQKQKRASALAAFSCLSVVLFCRCSITAAGETDSKASDFFERRIRPLLIERCLECHGSETQENGLRLDSLESMLKGGKHGPALVRGKPAESLLLESVRRSGKLKMPPDKPLKRVEIEAIEQWIRLGAPWPTTQALLTEHTKQEDRLTRLRRLREKHWAFQPLRTVTKKESESIRESGNAIDYFIREKLKTTTLSPSSKADRTTLIRRLYFDLVGLPPTIADVEAFVADQSPNAFEHLVERLLDQPEYGERWARHWLDVARYADTTGYQEGAQRRYPFAWTYRDYVVRSFNEDASFNEFILEQLAADQLDLKPGEQWKLAAMGFLTLGPRFNYVRHEIIDDRIDVVTRGLLGLTVTCARCHDHKYDPVLTDDYYGLYGVFASSREPLYAALPRIGKSRGNFARYREFRRKAAESTRKFEQFHARVHRRALHDLRAQAADYLRYLVQLMPEHRTVNQPNFETKRGYLRGPTPYGPGAIVRWQHYIATRGDNDAVFGLWNRLAALSKSDFESKALPLIAGTRNSSARLKDALLKANPRRMLDVASVYGEVLEQTYDRWTELRESDPEATRLPDEDQEQLRQVLYADDSPVVMNEDEAHDVYSDREFNQFMGMKRELDSLFVEYQDVAPSRAMILTDRTEVEEPRVFTRGQATRPDRPVARRFLRGLPIDGGERFSNGSGRLELAEAIANPANPLTARVIVNRVWQWHFGRGLVDSSSDFGTRASPPSHPRLLDWLAVDFIKHGWKLKRLHKRIVMSATWRQKSFESAAAHEIDPDNRLLSHMSRRRLAFEPLRDSLLAVSGRLDRRHGGAPVEELDSPRRSLYLLVDRDDPSDVFATFDSPSPDISIARRPETTIPQQALFLMNSGFVAGIVDEIVEQLESESIDDPAQQARWLYRRLLSRPPTEAELNLITQALRPEAADGTADSNSQTRHDLTQALLMSNAFLFVD